MAHIIYPTDITVVTNPTPTSSTSPIDDIIPNELWEQRMQDKGRKKEELKNKTYKQSKIPPIGPEGEQLYYPDLAANAIDLSKSIFTQNELKTGWLYLPKNKTDVKLKILNKLLALRKLHDGKYHLDQTRILTMFQKIWGAGPKSNVLHPNDRARLFGVVMTLEENREIYEKIALGVRNRADLDDVSMTLEQMFQQIALSFNNEDILLELPQEAYDVNDFDLINLNDPNCIKITRDCDY